MVTIHIGQAGTQIANALWELYCLEHGIRPDGYYYAGFQKYSEEDMMDTVFDEQRSGKCVPRVLIFDLEPTVVGNYFNLHY